MRIASSFLHPHTRLAPPLSIGPSYRSTNVGRMRVNRVVVVVGGGLPIFAAAGVVVFGRTGATAAFTTKTTTTTATPRTMMTTTSTKSMTSWPSSSRRDYHDGTTRRRHRSPPSSRGRCHRRIRPVGTFDAAPSSDENTDDVSVDDERNAVSDDGVAVKKATTTRTARTRTGDMPPLLHSQSSSPHTAFSSMYDSHLPLARDMMNYIDESPDPYHAVRNAVHELEGVGFVEWRDDDDASTLRSGGRYYFTRNGSALVAFAIGSKYDANRMSGGLGGGGYKIIGSHTDSPNLKVKPNSKRGANGGGTSGMLQIAVECYGGGLWHTWFDRDLGVSGRVFFRDGNDGDGDGGGRIRQVRPAHIALRIWATNGTEQKNMGRLLPLLEGGGERIAVRTLIRGGLRCGPQFEYMYFSPFSFLCYAMMMTMVTTTMDR
jgi:hypothetical protein